MEDLSSSIEKVIHFWKAQNIKIVPKAIEEILYVSKTNALQLPGDFIELYRQANGMRELYPNYTDAEGFLIYPIEAIVSAREEFGEAAPLGKRKIFIFSDYLIKCWWYGYEAFDDGSYAIGIVESRDDFRPITNSLAEFLELYMVDSDRMYDCSDGEN